MKVAVVGGGINGVMIAWSLARRNCAVTLYEQAGLMHATSSASTKMLHGGIRYLEHGRFDLVREALQERAWWLEHAPEFTWRIPILIPVYAKGARGKYELGAGVKLYDWLARGTGFSKSRWVGRSDLVSLFPDLTQAGLKGAWEYWDAQMDDRGLGMWAAERAEQSGVQIRTHARVQWVSAKGELMCNDERLSYERIVNATGPWASDVLKAGSVRSDYGLSLVRGSHLVIDRELPVGCVLQRWDDRRIVFTLPWRGKALLGTTEVLQDSAETELPSPEEVDYLLSTYSRFFATPVARSDVLDSFSGVRPLLRGRDDVSHLSREYAIERQGNLISVFGGKWTTSRALAEKVTTTVLN